LFSHPDSYMWSPCVYILINKYGLYPAFKKAGISPDFVLSPLDGWETGTCSILWGYLRYWSKETTIMRHCSSAEDQPRGQFTSTYWACSTYPT